MSVDHWFDTSASMLQVGCSNILLPSLKTLVKIQIEKTVGLFKEWKYFWVIHRCPHGILYFNMKRKPYNYRSIISIEIEPIEWVDSKWRVIILAYPIQLEWSNNGPLTAEGPRIQELFSPPGWCSEGPFLETGSCLNPKEAGCSVGKGISTSKNRAEEFTRERTKASGVKGQSSPSWMFVAI